MLNQPSSNSDKIAAAKKAAAELAGKAKARTKEYFQSGRAKQDLEKGTQTAKDLAAQAKNKTTDYVKSDLAQSHLEQGKKIAVSEKAKSFYKSMGVGALAVIASGQLGNAMNLGNKANVLGELDRTAKAELTQAEQKLETSKNEANQSANKANFGQKSFNQNFKDSMEGIDNKYRNLPGSDSLLSKVESDSKDITTDNNFVGYAIRGSNPDGATGVLGQDGGNQLREVKSKLQDYDQANKDSRQANDRYYQGDTMNPALQAAEESKKANSDAAGTFIAGTVVGGFALSKMKKKGEGEPDKLKTEPNPEPTPEPIPPTPEVAVETQTPNLDTGFNASEYGPQEAVQIKTEIEVPTPATIPNTEESFESTAADLATGFSAEEYGPKEAVEEKTAWQKSLDSVLQEPTPEAVIEAPVVQQAVIPEVKINTQAPVTNKPSWFQSVGRTLGQIGMGAAIFGGGIKGAEQLKSMPQFNAEAAPMTQVVESKTEAKVDISTETFVDPDDTSQEADASSAPSTEVPTSNPEPTPEVPVTTETPTVAPAETITATPEAAAAKQKELAGMYMFKRLGGRIESLKADGSAESLKLASAYQYLKDNLASGTTSFNVPDNVLTNLEPETQEVIRANGGNYDAASSRVTNTEGFKQFASENDGY